MFSLRYHGGKNNLGFPSKFLAFPQSNEIINLQKINMDLEVFPLADIVWSDSGSRIVIKDNYWGIDKVVDLTSNSIKEISIPDIDKYKREEGGYGGHPFIFDWLSDEELILYSYSQIWLEDIVKDERKEVLSICGYTNLSVHEVIPIPTNRSIIVVAEDKDSILDMLLLEINIDNLTCREIKRFRVKFEPKFKGERTISRVCISPDLKKIFYVDEKEYSFLIMDIEEGKLLDLTGFFKRFQWPLLSWISSSEVVYPANNMLISMDLNSLKPIPLAKLSKNYGIVAFQVSLKRRKVYFNAYNIERKEKLEYMVGKF